MKRTRRMIAVVLTVLMCFSLSQAVFAKEYVRVKVGGELLETGLKAFVENGRTMLPLRALFEKIGAKVGWDGETERITATKGDRTIAFQVGSNIMTVNGEERTMDVAPVVISNNTFIPLRACAEAFDIEVEWVEQTHTVKVKIPVSLRTRYVDKDGVVQYKWEYDDWGNMTLSMDQSLYGLDCRKLVTYGYDSFENVIYEKEERYFPSTGVKYDQHLARYEYDPWGNVIRMEKEEQNYQLLEKTSYVYDEQKNKMGSKMERFSRYKGGTYTKELETNITYEYDENGNEIYMTAEHDPGTTNWIKRTYDDSGRPIRVDYSVYDTPTIYEYDERGNEIGGIGKYVTRTYDEQGRLIKLSGPLGSLVPNPTHTSYVTTYEYDEWDNLVREKTVYNNGDTVETTHTYDGGGNLIRTDNADGSYTEYAVFVR
ncbi:MAG: hypothetical protein E7409_07435 [Ruminococcaceae bacterium]|nr:hypothetical protein [Oscillospiraceae bacterium]